MRRFALGLVCCLVAVYAVTAGDRITGKMFATRSEVIATNGMVATSQPLAVQVGIDILKKGGTAVDAAIAVNATLGLMEPTGSGIGGDLFAVVWDHKQKKIYGLNASGPSPRGLSLKHLKDQGYTQMPVHGPLPWTVPGCVAGWFELHAKFGKLSMEKLLAPAISYAEQGFPVSELIAHHWARSVNLFKKYRNFQKLYAKAGRAPARGEIFKNKELAGTLKQIATNGSAAFYKGPIAETILDFSKRVGGFFSAADLADYEPQWVTPLKVDYRGYRIWELPPNGQGLAVLQMMKMLAYFDLDKMGHNSAEYLHTLIEIKKIVYEDRARFFADPKFHQTPVNMLLSPAYAQKRMALLNPFQASRKLPYADEKLERGDTVYLTVVDKNYNAVSLIQSNYMGFGSGLVPTGTGFCLQDRGALFSLQEGHPNVYAPLKRPFHTIIPGFVTRAGAPVFSFGVMGGAMQPQGHVQILNNIIDFKMNIQEAGDAPRFRHSGSSAPDGARMVDGGKVQVESGVSPDVVRELMARGHDVTVSRGGFGGYQGIWIDTPKGVLYGASESRKDGCAAGY